MMRVIIESPYAGDIERNIRYAERAMLDSLTRGEAPFLSHLLYTRVWDDTVPDLRERGIAAGYAWWDGADKICFYIDYGFSNGMLAARKRVAPLGIPFEFRQIGENP